LNLVESSLGEVKGRVETKNRVKRVKTKRTEAMVSKKIDVFPALCGDERAPCPYAPQSMLGRGASVGYFGGEMRNHSTKNAQSSERLARGSSAGTRAGVLDGTGTNGFNSKIEI
jgi:hypothetical protein